MTIQKRILVATDFSPHAQCAVRSALELARALDAAITLAFVHDSAAFAYGIPYEAESLAAEEKELTEATAALRREWPNVSLERRSGTPWREICDAALAVRADFIVIGTHGRRGFAHALLGSVAEKVVRMSEVPVLTVPMPAR